MAQENSNNLSKVDIVSFIAILLLGVTVFFGMNFSTLGDKIPSIIVAIVLVVVMTVIIFFAAYAKKQNRNQAAWKKVEYAMLVLYVLALIPCYLYSSKFFDIYFNKSEITKEAEKTMDGIDKMFDEYNRQCESRCGSYQMALEAMAKDAIGRRKIASLLDISPDKVNHEKIEQAVQSFNNQLVGAEYEELVKEKDETKANMQNSLKNWNIMYLPQYASELGSAQDTYASELVKLYNAPKNDYEQNVPQFDPSKVSEGENIAEIFSKTTGFSGLGLLAIIILGGLGALKYVLGEGRTVQELKAGDDSVITNDGGFTI